MVKHSLLSGSTAKRWTECTPSARLCEGIEDAPSPYAEEGSECHLLGQHKIELNHKMPTEDPRPGMKYYNQEMEECSDIYLQVVNEKYADAKKYCKDPVLLVEAKLDFSRWVKDGYGYGDCIIIADHVIHVIDYKHGAGVLVNADNNTQMKVYSLAVLDQFGDLYDIDEVCMTIVQPRKDNISSWTISKDELLDWADNFLAPRAELAYEGKGEFKAGPHCQFCKVKSKCRARAERNLELAQHEFKLPDLLEDTEIAAILDKVDDLVSWANDVKDYALSQALAGKIYDGYKIVEGRSIRKYTDEGAVAEAVTAAGFDPYEKKLLGLTAMTQMLGKKKFEEVLGSPTCKPKGKPVLVPNSDKRPTMTINTAAEDFSEN